MIDLRRAIWSKEEYYQRIAAAEDFSHPGFRRVVELCKKTRSILDVGCGDGSKLALLGGAKARKAGLEVSDEAISLGKKKNPGIKFVHGVGENIPFPDGRFERVVSLFVIEHSDRPDRFVSEMIRVTAEGGEFCLLAPNFGAPNRASPNNKQSRIKKLALGIIKDLLHFRKDLGWERVTPRIRNMMEFESDLDTTVEPYILSLLRFLQGFPVRVVEASSFWKMEEGNAKLWQKVFRFFGERGVYPFVYWGPHLFLVAERR